MPFEPISDPASTDPLYSGLSLVVERRRSSLETLTPDAVTSHLAALDVDGYTLLPGAVDAAVLDELRAEVDGGYARLTSSGAVFVGGGTFSGHLNCFPGVAARAAYQQVVDAGVVDIVRKVNADWAERPRVTLNYNLPGSVAQHYHMDGVYTRDFLIVNVAVVDTDLVNGAIDLLPGTNQQFYPFWKYALQRQYHGTTRIPVKQGDIIIRRSTLWHRGMPNLSDRPRPMLAVTYGEMPEPTLDPFQTNDGAMEFYPNWFRPTRLGRLREKVFVKAPISYAAYRFVRSLDGKKGYAS